MFKKNDKKISISLKTCQFSHIFRPIIEPDTLRNVSDAQNITNRFNQ